MRRLSRLAALVLWCVPVCAWAFQIESIVSTGCHERLARAVTEGAVWPNATPRPLSTLGDRALVANLEFTAPSDSDTWLLSVLIGVRDNDLHGAALLDLPDLVAVHNGSDSQVEHCLRTPQDDGDEGDRQALESCRAFILSEVALALGDEAQPNLDATEDVTVALLWETRGLPLQRFGFHLGRAMHALQDSFTHAFRTDDLRRVESVLNWIDPVLAWDYSPARDGWPHQSSLDACDGDAATVRRVEAARQASQGLVRAVMGEGDRASRLAGTSALLDEWLTYEPGCDAENDFCGQAVLGPGCSSTAGSPLLPLLGVALLLTSRRPRTAGRGGPPAPHARPATPVPPGRWPRLLIAGVLLVAPLAAAQEVNAAAPARSARFSLHAAVGASIDRGGGTLAVGGGVALGPHVRLRADLELNPWLDTVSGRMAPGALSAYGTFMWCWTEVGRVELSSSVSVGASALLFNTTGAEAGSFGLFAGVSMVRVGIRLSDRLAFEFNPEAVVAVPSLKGVPLAYRQYRATAGLRWDFGG